MSVKKTLFFYARVGWEEDFNKGTVFGYPTQVPNLYVNREHIRALNTKDWKEIKESFGKYFKKVKVTIEDHE